MRSKVKVNEKRNEIAREERKRDHFPVSTELRPCTWVRAKKRCSVKACCQFGCAIWRQQGKTTCCLLAADQRKGNSSFLMTRSAKLHFSDATSLKAKRLFFLITFVYVRYEKERP